MEPGRRALLSRERDPAALRDEVVKMRAKMHEGHPKRSALFDLKHDEGGMVDIEFIVQFLVLAHAPRHPELLDNAGNIGKMYRRQDESGTPVCITVDYDSLTDNSVTDRDRDTMEQRRVPVEDISHII